MWSASLALDLATAVCHTLAVANWMVFLLQASTVLMAASLGTALLDTGARKATQTRGLEMAPR